jgi:transcriptional regulator with XRE-family HTH domain
VDILYVFAKNVRMYRQEKQYSQERLAEESGLHRTYISAVERCRRSIALENIQKIADALGIATYLLFIDNSTQNNEGNNVFPLDRYGEE